MRRVAVAGIGSTRFGRSEGRSIKALAIEAAEEAIADSQIPRDNIEALMLGNFMSGVFTGQEALAPLLAHELALDEDVEATKVEGACASSAIACRIAYQLIATGQQNVALVVGAEKMTGASREASTAALVGGSDIETDGATGMTFPGFWGLIMRRHMRDFGTTREQIAAVTVKNRRNGVHNDKAQFRSEVTIDEALNSRTICDPVLLLDCCPVSDGAAALVLAAEDVVRGHSGLVEILGSGQASGPGRVADYADITTFPATVRAARKAYEMADVGPDAIDFVELHDCFSIAEIVDSEDLGFFAKGDGGKAVEGGFTDIGGDIPINPSGGLLCKGHPVGATGTGQIYEVVRQLRGEHPNQVPNARIGMTHNAGGVGAVATVHILGSME